MALEKTTLIYLMTRYFPKKVHGRGPNDTDGGGAKNREEEKKNMFFFSPCLLLDGRWQTGL